MSRSLRSSVGSISIQHRTASTSIREFALGLPAGVMRRFSSLRSSSRWTRHPWPHSHLAWVYRLNGDYAASVEERALSLELDSQPEEARLMRESFATGGWDRFRHYVRQADVNPLWAGILDEDEKKSGSRD